MTHSGVRPLADTLWKRDTYWLYGAVEPETGEQFYLEMNKVDKVCFECFLKHFSKHYPNEHHFIQVDNAAFHNTANIEVPDNITLLHQPAYSPDTNPIERVWSWIKSKIKGIKFYSLDTLKNEVWKIIQQTSHKKMSSLTYWPHIQRAIREFRS